MPRVAVETALGILFSLGLVSLDYQYSAKH